MSKLTINTANFIPSDQLTEVIAPVPVSIVKE